MKMNLEESDEKPIESSLSDHVAEAKARLSGEGLKPVKRARGRPRGSTKKNLATKSTITGSTTDAPGATNSDGASVPASEPIDIPVALLKPVLQFPFRIVATKTGFEGFTLSDDEADAMAPMLDQVLKAYCPQMTGPQATLAALFGSLAVITSTKYMAMLEWKNRRNRVNNEHQGVIMPGINTTESTPPPPPPNIVQDENYTPVIDPAKMNLKKLFK